MNCRYTHILHGHSASSSQGSQAVIIFGAVPDLLLFYHGLAHYIWFRALQSLQGREQCLLLCIALI